MPRRLKREDALLAVIDVQERLAPVINGVEEVIRNIDRLMRGTKILGVPMLLTEQYVKGLGPSCASIRDAASESHGYQPIEKMCFSSYGCDTFSRALRESERKAVILAGVETHVCVYQTAIELLDSDFDVYVVADAVSSRSAENKDIALRRMESEGAKLTSTEMILLELTQTSGTDEFRAISKLIK